MTLAGFAIVALALASCGDDETAGDEQTLTYFEGLGGQLEFFGPGAGPEGPPVPGGGAAISGALEDADGNPVGEVNSSCITTGSEEGGDHVCTGLVDLPDGQLNIAYGGDIEATGGPRGVTGSIIGGTGDYAGATGTYEVVFPEGPPEEGPPPQPPKNVFTFTLP